MAMPTLQFAMYMDEESYEQYSQNQQKWHEAFHDDIVPMALASDGERIAIRKFARAWRKHRRQGAIPRWLLQGSIPSADALGHIVKDEIEVMSYRQRKLCACICVRSSNQLHI